MNLVSHVKEALINLRSSHSDSTIHNPSFTSSQLVIQIREQGYRGIIFPDSISTVVSQLYNNGLVLIDTERSRYSCSPKLIEESTGSL